MAKFLRNGLFVPRDEYTPPAITYKHVIDTRNIYYNLLAETNNVVKYPIAIGRQMVESASVFADVPLPHYRHIDYYAPLPQNIPTSTLTSELSTNQQLAATALNLRRDVREYSRTPVHTPAPILTNAIIKLGTGQGKTRLIGHVINALGKKALIIVGQISLIKQTIAELKLLLPATTIGHYYGAKQANGDIVVITHKSLCAAKKNGQFKFGKMLVAYLDFIAEIGTICYDEIHTYCTPKYWHIFDIGVDNMIGFSATPEQCPHIVRAVAAVGPIIDIAKLPGYDSGICKFALTVTFIEYSAPEFIHAEERNNRLDYHALMSAIRADTKRTAMIVQLCRKLIANGAVIFVFCCVREYAIGLRRLFEGHENDYEPADSVLLIGDTPEDVQDRIMEAAKTTARVIFTTYGYSDTGLSISRANTCILAEPRNSNMIQRTGRIMRADGTGDFRNVYDIIDAKTPIKNQYKKRIPAYNERAAAFVVVKGTKVASVY